MFKKLKAFTISELLIALGVIAILTTVLMPIVHSLIPDQNTLMSKRAFYTVETVINALINDDGCYPTIRTETGFTDGSPYKKCSGWSTGNATNANQKFTSMFIDKLDVKGNVTTSGGKTTFETKDGMQWEFKSIGFASRDYTVLVIDVNGTNKGPNCGQNSESGACTGSEAGRTNGFDKFAMHIHPSGKIDILDCWAVKSVRTDKKLIGKFDEIMDCVAPPTSPLSCVNKPSSADDPCCASTKWRDKEPCSSDPCAVQPTSQDSVCCSDPRWSEKPPCYIAPPPNQDPCANEPTDPNDLCCNDARYIGLGVCDACAKAPQDKNNVCCSDPRWIATLVCDPCMAKPTSCNSTCCSDSRWSNDTICDCCPSIPTSENDACCSDNRYKELEACVKCPDNPSNGYVNNKCCEKWNSAGKLSKGDEISQSCCNVTNNKFDYCTQACSDTPTPSEVSEECCNFWGAGKLDAYASLMTECCNYDSFKNANKSLCPTHKEVSWNITPIDGGSGGTQIQLYKSYDFSGDTEDDNGNPTIRVILDYDCECFKDGGIESQEAQPAMNFYSDYTVEYDKHHFPTGYTCSCHTKKCTVSNMKTGYNVSNKCSGSYSWDE